MASRIETYNEVEDTGGFLVERKANLLEVAYDLFEKEKFGIGDVVLVDNDETLVPTWQNFLRGDDFKKLPRDTKTFLDLCDNNGVEKAIITNMPRANHYMNHVTPVFGYEHYFNSGILRKTEFPLSLCLGSLYKETQKSLYEVASWSMHKGCEEGRIAWIGNSYLDKGFAVRLEKVLRELDFKNDFYFYKLPAIRSFRF